MAGSKEQPVRGELDEWGLRSCFLSTLQVKVIRLEPGKFSQCWQI